jgi:hypothetical protein
MAAEQLALLERAVASLQVDEDRAMSQSQMLAAELERVMAEMEAMEVGPSCGPLSPSFGPFSPSAGPFSPSSEPGAGGRAGARHGGDGGL